MFYSHSPAFLLVHHEIVVGQMSSRRVTHADENSSSCTCEDASTPSHSLQNANAASHRPFHLVRVSALSYNSKCSVLKEKHAKERRGLTVPHRSAVLSFPFTCTYVIVHYVFLAAPPAPARCCPALVRGNRGQQSRLPKASCSFPSSKRHRHVQTHAHVRVRYIQYILVQVE